MSFYFFWFLEVASFN